MNRSFNLALALAMDCFDVTRRLILAGFRLQKFHIELLQAAARPIECNQSIRDAQLLRNNISLGEKSCDSGPPINLLSRGLVGCDK